MEITCVNINDLEESVVASGLPMLTMYDKDAFRQDAFNLCTTREQYSERCRKHMERCVKLARLGSPHCNFLTGITVSFNVTATQAFFLQAHRYHWWQVVSSQSKMHRLEKMLLQQCKLKEAKIFHPSTSHMVAFEPLYRKDCLKEECKVEDMVYNVPMGLETTERVSTNYQQLRNIYAQRKDHRLQEWKDFCKWIESLPFAKDFLMVEREGKKEG